MMLNYLECIKKLFAMPVKGVQTFGAFQILDSKLGFPHRAFRSIHVGGTNGKGSVSTKIAAALRADGFCVGLYTSPHISCVRERIRVNGEMISEESFSRLFSKVMHEAGSDCSYFDHLTALAFLFFREAKVDWAVIEVGLGGRLDPTNVISSDLAIITSIGFDHKEILGDTLEMIAKEKGGIAKRGTPLIVGPNAALFFPDAEHVATSNKGFYDVENSSIAACALKKLGISQAAIDKGLSVRPSCRFERFGRSVLDVAHNPQGVSRLVEALGEAFPNEQFHFIVGFTKGKEWEACLDLLRPKAARISLVHPHSKLLPLGTKSLEGLVGIDREREVFCGSFYLMAEARRILGIVEPRDPE